MIIYEKAKELAEAIVNSEELKAVKDAEATIACDPEARQLVEEYQKLQELFMEKSFEELSEEEQKKVETLEKKMSQNKCINDYMETQQKLEQVLRSVNLIISNALNDNDEHSGCTSCSSCSTCC